MTAQQLKASILQLAIQGKLVPQNPADEPASVLLKKIKAEKDALVKAGKIKKDKHESVIVRNEDGRYLEKKDGKTTDITDEIPFDIPESWEWMRLGSIGTWKAGATPSRNDDRYYKGGTIPWLKTGDLNDGYITSIPEFITEKALAETSVHLNPVGSVLIAMYGATIGKLGILQIEATTNQACCACQTFSLVKNTYLFLFLLSQRKNFTSLGAGGAQPNISKEKIVNFLFPLPPLEEQKRIVAKIEELLPHVEEYGKAETDISKLNAELPEQLKKSILQWAIQGRLVPQDPTDEPASELLKRIKAEKSALIKSGKLKKEKPLPPISEDEIPFDIPDSWQWVRLGSIITLISGQDFPPSGYNDRQDGIPYITGASNMDNGKLIVNRWTPSPSSIALQGDLLITCKGAGVGKMALMDIPKAHVARQIMAIRPVDGVNASFVKAFIQSNLPTVRRQMNGLIPGISREVMLQFLFPLPPLAEQKRIVEKLESILSTLDVQQ